MIRHYPVMLQNVLRKIQSLKIQRPIRIADCNFGFGGHSHAILKQFPKSLIQGFELDPSVIAYYNQHYSKQIGDDLKKRMTITNNNFNTIEQNAIFQKFDVVLTDFGFNSYHLEIDKGFSWLKEENLDMRYSPEFKLCSNIINQSSILQLTTILSQYGELRESKRVAELISENRPMNTTKELRQAISQAFQQNKTRKIAQVFQAFRIVTNGELKAIQKLCESLQQVLQKNGLVIAITFHSLQRDIIHKFVKSKPKIFSKVGTQEPSKEELKQNSRSQSAKMLTFMKKN